MDKQLLELLGNTQVIAVVLMMTAAIALFVAISLVVVMNQLQRIIELLDVIAK